MDQNQIESEAQALQAALEEKKLMHYDDVQLAMLARASEIKLNWDETRAFSAKVHELRRKTLSA